ncbi:MAG: TVP38/TMEM64 family protein, partial [Alphaproteobacteria bacterium]
APLLVLMAGLIAFFALGLHRYVTIATLSENRQVLLDWVERGGAMAGLVFVLVYAVATAFSIPGGALMTITGGFLFGIVFGTLYVLVGATLGATALFLAARTALRKPLQARVGPAIKKMEAGFQENAVNYMLVLRLVPIVPFWLVNLVPALVGVPLSIYVVTTFFGIIPGTLVYSSLGNGLGTILDAGGEPDLGIVFEPKILLPLIGLALLALVPVIYKKVKARKDGV